MDMAELIAPEAILPTSRVATKKRALQEISRRAAALTGLEERAILDALTDRERLGSTGVGVGVAIPHARIAGLSRHTGFFLRLARPIPFDAVDGAPVDLLFALLVPEDSGSDHLTALAQIARTLRDRNVCNKLRGTDHPDAMFALLTERDRPNAA